MDDTYISKSLQGGFKNLRPFYLGQWFDFLGGIWCVGLFEIDFFLSELSFPRCHDLHKRWFGENEKEGYIKYVIVSILLYNKITKARYGVWMQCKISILAMSIIKHLFKSFCKIYNSLSNICTSSQLVLISLLQLRSTCSHHNFTV